MKNEFNLQSLNPLSTSATAFVIALPALMINVSNYGWGGLALLTSITAGVMIKMRQRLDNQLLKSRNIRQRLGVSDEMTQSLNNLIANFEQHSAWQTEIIAPDAKKISTREQNISRKLSPAFGLPTVQVSYHDDSARSFVTDLIEIRVNPKFSQQLSDKEIEYIIAHELDHVREDRDRYRLLPLGAFSKVSAWAGVATAAMSLVNLPVSPLPGVVPSLLGSLASVGFLYAANTSIWKSVECRCDSNALRVTGDLDAAKSSLSKVHAMANERLHRPTTRIASKILSRHPSLQTRMKNLDRTWQRMQAEKSTAIHTPKAP